MKVLMLENLNDPPALNLRVEGMNFCSSREDYAKNFKRLLSSFERWINYLTSSDEDGPIYDVFVTRDMCPTNGNGRIINVALEKGKKCFYYDGEKMIPIKGISWMREGTLNPWEIEL